jgi:Spy/CpxP family protein refolding chaperone
MFKSYKAFVCLLLLALSLVSVHSDEVTRYAALNQLDLTEAQKVQIAGIKSAQQGQINSLQADLKANQDKLKALLQNDAASDEEIAGVRTKIDSTQNALSDAKVKSWLKIKAVLTPEQVTKLRSLRFKH